MRWAGRTGRPLVAAISLLGLGCATGNLLEAGRLQEWPSEYREAHLEGERLWLAFESRWVNAAGEEVGREESAASFDLAALAASEEWPVDRFPLRRESPHRHRCAGAPPLPLVLPELQADSTDPAEAEDGPRVRVLARDGQVAGLRLEGLREPLHDFHSGALARRRTAGWVYPLLPLSVTFDVITTPVLIFLAGPFLTTVE